MLLSYFHGGHIINRYLWKHQNDNYVKPWKHNKINQKGEMALASFEELESEDIAISTDSDRISDLVREGNFMYTLINLSIFILIIFYFNAKYIYESCLIQWKWIWQIECSYLCVGDLFVVVAPIDNNGNVRYYLMRCIERKMKLLEDYDDKGFIYERGPFLLKGFFSSRNTSNWKWHSL